MGNHRLDKLVESPYVHVPITVSLEAQAFLATLEDPHRRPAFPDPDNIAGWDKLQAWAEADGNVEERELGGVPVRDVRPKHWSDNGKAIVYTHGGAHTMYSASSMLGRAAVAAHETGLRVISVDYTLAPHAKYNQMSDQVVAAIQALLKEVLMDLGSLNFGRGRRRKGKHLAMAVAGRS